MSLLLGQVITGFEVFILVFVRMSGLFLMSPIFGRQNIPAYLKIGFSLMLSYMVYSSMFLNVQIEILSFYAFGILAFKEILIGFVVGFITTLIFASVWTAGQFIDTQIGFGMVNVLDPQNRMQVPLMGNFKNILALLVFFVINGHHTLIKLIFYSYNIIPLGEGMISQETSLMVARVFTNSFVLAIKIAIPIVAIAFLSEMAFGILVRTVPQMNIFIIGIPLKIFVGLIAILIFIPVYIGFLNGVFDGMFNDVEKALLRMSYR